MFYISHTRGRHPKRQAHEARHDHQTQSHTSIPAAPRPAGAGARGYDQLRPPDTGPSCHSDGSKPTPHPAHTGGLPEARRCIPVPWPPGPQASQRYSRGDQEQGGSPGSHGVQRWGLPWSTTQAAMSAQQVAPCRASGELPTSSSQSTKTAETCSAVFHIDPQPSSVAWSTAACAGSVNPVVRKFPGCLEYRRLCGV